MVLQILRPQAFWKRCGDSRSAFYEKMSQGLVPVPIKLGKRSRGFLEYEAEAIVAARAAGIADDQLRKLVFDLQAIRAQLAGKTDAEVRSMVRDLVTNCVQPEVCAKGRQKVGELF